MPVRYPGLNSNPMGWLVLAAHATIVACGLYGLFVAPAPPVEALLGPLPARYLWSSNLIFWGAGATWGRFRRDYDIEVVALLGVGASFLLWSLFVYLELGPRAGQQSLGLISIGLHAWGWAGAIRWWATREREQVVQVEQALGAVIDENGTNP